MSHACLYKLAGLSSGIGGLLGAGAHFLEVSAPADPAQLAQYATLNQAIHLILFAGGILVLLGLGLFAFHLSASGTGLAAFLLIFVGILFADVPHCVLEFSVFPLLMARVPYATPGLAEGTYHATPLAAIQSAGRFLLLTGVPLAALSLSSRCRLLRWSALPFAVTAVLMAATLIPALRAALDAHAATAFYLSMSILGVALFRISDESASLRFMDGR